MAVLKFEQHSAGVPGGISCNYISNRNGNTYWISCIPCNSAADMKEGNTYEMKIFVVDRGHLECLKTFKYKLRDYHSRVPQCPPETLLSVDAVGFCDSVTEVYEAEP